MPFPYHHFMFHFFVIKFFLFFFLFYFFIILSFFRLFIFFFLFFNRCIITNLKIERLSFRLNILKNCNLFLFHYFSVKIRCCISKIFNCRSFWNSIWICFFFIIKFFFLINFFLIFFLCSFANSFFCFQFMFLKFS